MKTLILICLLFCSTAIFAQDTTFTKRYYTDTSNYDIVSNGLTTNLDDGVIVCGNYYGNSNTGGLLVSTDSMGGVLWNRTFSSTTSPTSIIDVLTTTDSFLLVSGYNLSTSNSMINSVFCAKLNFEGDTLWTKSFEMTKWVDYYTDYVGVEELSDSSYLLVSSNPDDSLSKLVKLSPNGTLEWEKKLEGEAFKINRICANRQDSSFLLAGTIGNSDGGIVKMTNQGEIEWSKKYLDNSIYDVIQFHDNIFMLNNYAGLMKLNQIGNAIWSKMTSASYSPFDQTTNHLPTLFRVGDTLIAVKGNDYYQSDVEIFDTSGVKHNNLSVGMAASHLVKNENGKVFISGNGPLYGIKNTLFSGHFGLITTNLQLDPSSCSWVNTNNSTNTQNVIVDTLLFVNSNNASEIAHSYLLDSVGLTVDDECVTLLGSLEKQDKINVKVYPNITTGKTHFDFSKNGSYQIVITTLEGRTVQEVEVKGNSALVDLSNHSSGIFIYKILGNGETWSGKIIKR